MRRVGKFRDKNGCGRKPASSDTDEESSGNEHAGTIRTGLEAGSKDDEEESGVKARLAAVSICNVGFDRKRDQATNCLNCIDEAQLSPPGMVHESLPLVERL